MNLTFCLGIVFKKNFPHVSTENISFLCKLHSPPSNTPHYLLEADLTTLIL